MLLQRHHDARSNENFAMYRRRRRWLADFTSEKVAHVRYACDMTKIDSLLPFSSIISLRVRILTCQNLKSLDQRVEMFFLILLLFASY